MTVPMRVIRLAGLATALGGALWAGCAAITASRPPGIVGGDYRQTDDLAPFVLASLVLFALGLAALYVRRTDQPGLLSIAGLSTGLVGVALVVAGSTVRFITSTDTSLTPLFLIPGAVLFMAGVVLTMIASLRSGVLPRWVGGVLIAAALIMLLFNSEDARAWFAVPLGLAWISVGYVLAFGQQPSVRIARGDGAAAVWQLAADILDGGPE